MLWLVVFLPFLPFSRTERVAKLNRIRSTLSDNSRRTSSGSSQSNSITILDPPDNSDFDNSDFIAHSSSSRQTSSPFLFGNDLDHMRNEASSLLQSLNGLRVELADVKQLKKQQESERIRLLGSVSESIAVVALALNDIEKLVDSEVDSSDNSNSRRLRSLSHLLSAGEDEELKLRAHLMQMKRQWLQPSSLDNDWNPISILPSRSRGSEGWPQLRMLLPENLQNVDYDQSFDGMYEQLVHTVYH